MPENHENPAFAEHAAWLQKTQSSEKFPCPWCKMLLNHYNAILPPQSAPWMKGDILVCSGCGRVLEFGQNELLFPVTGKTWKPVSREEKKQYRKAGKAVRQLNAQKELDKIPHIGKDEVEDRDGVGADSDYDFLRAMGVTEDEIKEVKEIDFLTSQTGRRLRRLEKLTNNYVTKLVRKRLGRRPRGKNYDENAAEHYDEMFDRLSMDDVIYAEAERIAEGELLRLESAQ